MNRPIHLWSVFLACLLLAAGALGWVTWHTLKLEGERTAAITNADHQERLRLAMWRMDFAASGLVIRENSRRPEEFRAFSPAWNGLSNNFSQEPLPSPLIKETPPGVLLHFELDAAGALNCPQVPEGVSWTRAKPFVTDEEISPANVRLAQLRTLLGRTIQPALSAFCSPAHATPTNWMAVNGMACSNPITVPPPLVVSSQIGLSNRTQQAPAEQIGLNNFEADNRRWIFQNNSSSVSPNRGSATSPAQSPAAFAGYWIEDQLFLTRVVRNGVGAVTQGIWLDWPKLKTTWEDLVRDILPAASLESVPASTEPSRAPDFLHLASLPVKLSPGVIPSTAAPESTARTTLITGWLAALAAAAALGLLLFRTISLSERRAAFVSAVTHELRTPLTTFQLYTELLVKEMLPDPESRRTYLETLHHEAGRLNHLVENVLSFARLERGSARSRVEEQTIQAHLNRIEPRLAKRAAEAGLGLQLEIHPDAQSQPWCVDVTSLEQILLNLTDNAAKYAGFTEGRKSLELLVTLHGNKVHLRLCDHGPGISKEAAKRIFTPFHKSAADAAKTAPGVGLGLSLSRRLARQLGGDLTLESVDSPGVGATFLLELPLTSA